VSGSSIPSSPADLALIEQLRNELQFAQLKIRVLEERLRLQRIEKYGRGSEKLADDQLELLDLEPGVSNVEVQAESQRERIPRSRPSRRRPHPGRQQLPAHLPRVERILHCTPEQDICGICEKETVLIGYDVSEQGVMAAPLPAQIIEKGLASNQVVINTLVEKYCNHIPLYRQSTILERDTGLELSRVTLDGWVMKSGELLIPMAGAMRLELLRESYLQADETPVWVQMQERRGKHHQAYLWQYGRPGGIAVFDFQMGRERAGPKQFLGQFNGLLQTDGYKAYDHTGGPKMVHAACWSHAERYFDNVIKLNPQDPVATPILKEIHELFAIDAEARERGLSLEARQALRLEKSKPLLEGINELVKAAAKTALPASALAKACNYTLTLWERLKLFMEYPELELSNNLAENSMRPVAIGRRNWIHVGSALAGPKVAAILSVVESCRRLKISVRDYLNAILPGLANVPVSRIPELTPSAWARQP
jgi:transposase